MKTIEIIVNLFPHLKEELTSLRSVFLDNVVDYRQYVISGCGWVCPDYMAEEFCGLYDYPTLDNIEIIILGLYMADLLSYETETK